MCAPMKSIGELLHTTEHFLASKGWQQPRLHAREILAFSLNLKPLDLYLYFDRPLQEAEVHKIREVLKERLQKRPLAYISNQVTFYDCDLYVDEHVLIPRPETEILVDHVMRWMTKNGTARVLDMCTGSGCIAIALKKAAPHVEVVAVDICPQALDVAKRNGLDNLVAIDWMQSDLFENLDGVGVFDIIVSNPPYISQKEYQQLDEEVRLHEPEKALLGGDSGLEFYEKLAKVACNYLAQGGALWLEIGWQQGNAVSDLLQRFGFENVQVIQDWSLKDRFIVAQKSTASVY